MLAILCTQQAAYARLIRNLTPAEWQLYLPDESYQVYPIKMTRPTRRSKLVRQPPACIGRSLGD